MLFFVKNGFCQDDWKLNFSYQILKSTLTSESSFILTKHITWLPTKKPCDLSACPRIPAGSGLPLQCSNVLKTSVVPLAWPLPVAILECLENSSLSCQGSHLSAPHYRWEKLFLMHVMEMCCVLFLTSSPEVVFGAQASCAELNLGVLYPFCWTFLHLGPV